MTLKCIGWEVAEGSERMKFKEFQENVDVCEWKKVDEEGYQNCKCNYDETIPDFFKYCPYCGKKIKVVE